MSVFDDIKPRNGDVVLHCGHHRGKEWNWFLCEPPAPFKRRDGTEDRAQWLMACDPCFLAADGDPKKVEVREYGVWDGNDPVRKAVA